MGHTCPSRFCHPVPFCLSSLLGPHDNRLGLPCSLLLLITPGPGHTHCCVCTGTHVNPLVTCPPRCTDCHLTKLYNQTLRNSPPAPSLTWYKRAGPSQGQMSLTFPSSRIQPQPGWFISHFSLLPCHTMSSTNHSTYKAVAWGWGTGKSATSPSSLYGNPTTLQGSTIAPGSAPVAWSPPSIGTFWHTGLLVLPGVHLRLLRMYTPLAAKSLWRRVVPSFSSKACPEPHERSQGLPPPPPVSIPPTTACFNHLPILPLLPLC